MRVNIDDLVRRITTFSNTGNLQGLKACLEYHLEEAKIGMPKAGDLLIVRRSGMYKLIEHKGCGNGNDAFLAKGKEDIIRVLNLILKDSL